MCIRPEGAEHPEDCPICEEAREVATGEIIDNGGTHVSEKTYTSDEVEALVAAAVAKATEELSAELEGFKSSQETAEIDEKIAAAKAEAEAQVAEIQMKLDESVIEAQQAKQERDEIMAWLEATAADAALAAEVEARRESRIAAVAEVVTFPEEYVAERASKWAAQSDDEFEVTLADYRAIAEKLGTPAEEGTSTPPAAAAMHATRETSNAPTRKIGSAVQEVLRMRSLGEDPRDIR